MRTVLGIDAAWTAHNPSGVALACETGSGWHLLAAAPSYSAFYAQPETPDTFDAQAILDTALHLTGAHPDLIAIDMPLANALITSRRISDNQISAHYGGRSAGTHSPSAIRPGPLSLDISTSLAARGYPLHFRGPLAAAATIEVYPHPALIELTGAPKRLPYKITKRGQYWPELNSLARIEAIFAQWGIILTHLDNVLPGATDLLPLPPVTAPIRTLKAFEDTLDAVICAWVGACVMDGNAQSYGDDTSAIWVPHSPVSK